MFISKIRTERTSSVVIYHKSKSYQFVRLSLWAQTFLLVAQNEQVENGAIEKVKILPDT
jgi:hypothetical protein